MATAVGDLVINLLARNKASGPIGTVSQSLRQLGGVLAGIAGVGGFGLMIREQFKAIDALAKTSDKLGEATEQLLGLHHAATLSGVSTKTLDMALQRMTRRISEAARGTGEAKDAIRELGLDAETLASMGPGAAMSAIADAMQRVSGEGDRVRLAMKLFDSEGVALVNTLAVGSAGLSQLQTEVESLGGAFSRTDASKIEAANNAMARLKLAASGGFARIAIGIAPAIAAISDGLAPALAFVGRTFGAIMEPMQSTMRFALKLAAGFVAAKVAALGLASASKLYGAITLSIAAALKAYSTAVTAITLAMEIYRATTSKAAAITTFFQLIASPAGWIKIGAAITVATAAIIAMDRAMASAGESVPTVASNLADVADTAPGIDRVSDAVGNLGDNAEEARNKLASLKETLGVLLLSGSERLSEAERLGQALEASGVDVFGRGSALPPSYASVVLEMEELVSHFGSASVAASAYQRAIDDSQSPLQAYQARLADIAALQEIIGEATADALRADALAEYDRALGGPQQKFRDMADELARLKAGASEFEWQLRKWEEAGVAGVDGMRDMQAEIDRLNAVEETAKEEKEKRDEAFAKTALRGSAAIAGSAEAYSRIYAAMDGGKGDPAKATAENTKSMKSDLARMREGIEEMRRGRVKLVTIEEAAA